jgi:hypothetical protein
MGVCRVSELQSETIRRGAKRRGRDWREPQAEVVRA